MSIISSIPRGRVATYGQIARLAGDPGAARQVVRVLHAYSAAGLPWHRVLSADGREQRHLLELDGIRIDGKGLVPLELHQ